MFTRDHRHSLIIGFKAATDRKAIELLKTYIAYVQTKKAAPSLPLSPMTLKDDVETRPESCVTANAEWVLPWVWRRRAADTTFAMVMTSAWLTSACSIPVTESHPAFVLVATHAENAFDVFHVRQGQNLRTGLLTTRRSYLGMFSPMSLYQTRQIQRRHCISCGGWCDHS